jgi:hypothetical protein
LILHRSAITSELFRFKADGSRRSIDTVLEFKISSASTSTNAAAAETGDAIVQEGPSVKRATDAAAEGEEYNVAVTKMEEAVPQALERIASSPSSAQRIQTAVEVSTTTADHVLSAATTWGSLLDNVKLFTDLMDKVAEVRH